MFYKQSSIYIVNDIFTYDIYMKIFFRILLGVALIFAGIGHLTFARKEFQAQVPDWLFLDADLVVLLSGFVEIALGAGLFFAAKYKAQFGLSAAIFFILIFPGNISQYVNGVDAFGLNSDNARFIRLLFQPVLIAWAIFTTDAQKLLVKRKIHY